MTGISQRVIAKFTRLASIFERGKLVYPCALSVILVGSAALGDDAVQLARASNQTSDATKTDNFMNFSDMKSAVVGKISGAKSRVWLTTDYLTDGDVVGALHLAKYRKIDVKVLLGRRKVNAYMSRVRFLKEQNIPTLIRPPSFPVPVGSAILSDNQLFLIDGDLDFRTNQQNFKMATAATELTQSYALAFERAANGEPEIKATPVPIVGQHRPNLPGRLAPYSPGSRAGQARAGTVRAIPDKAPATNSNGAYHYGSQRNSRPEGIPNRLPKVLKWKEIERQRNRQQAPNGR